MKFITEIESAMTHDGEHATYLFIYNGYKATEVFLKTPLPEDGEGKYYFEACGWVAHASWFEPTQVGVWENACAHFVETEEKIKKPETVNAD